MITRDVLKEAWQGVDFSEFHNDTLQRPTADDARADSHCICTIPDLDTDRHLVVNGFGETDIVVRKGSQQQRPIQIQSVWTARRSWR